MDELDQNLFEAWEAVSKLLQDRPWALARRMERASRKELRRPVRAWCVALRASDARIGAQEWRTGNDANLACDGEPHVLMLTGQRLRQLCRPVSIDWPGVTVPAAAKLLACSVLDHDRPAIRGRHAEEGGSGVGINLDCFLIVVEGLVII